MKAPLIRFVVFLCILSQCCVIFSGQPSESWVQSKIYGLKKAAAEKAGSWWYGRKKETDIISPFQKGMESVTMAKQVGELGLISGTTGLSKSMIDALVDPFPLLKGMQTGGMALPMSMLAGVFIMGFAVQKVVASYRAQDIKKETAINEIKDIISIELTKNIWAYPTRSTKINALLKKNEFVIDIQGLDEGLKKELETFIAEACNQLIGDISKKPAIKEDKAIDEEISRLRAQLIQIPMLDDKIIFIQSLNLATVLPQKELINFGDLVNVMVDAKVIAAFSELLRLTKQKVFEEIYKGKSQAKLSQAELRQQIAESAKTIEEKKYKKYVEPVIPKSEEEREKMRALEAALYREEYKQKLQEKRRKNVEEQAERMKIQREIGG